MATLAKTFTFPSLKMPINDEANINFDDVINYVNDRNSGTAKWEFVKADRLIITARVADPSSLTAGEIWFNSTDKQFYGYDGTTTVILG